MKQVKQSEQTIQTQKIRLLDINPNKVEKLFIA